MRQFLDLGEVGCVGGWRRVGEGSNLQLLYWVSLPEGENIISAMSISHSTDNSYAFLMRPFRLFEYVTCLLVGFSIFLISSLTLPIATAAFGTTNPCSSSP